MKLEAGVASLLPLRWILLAVPKPMHHSQGDEGRKGNKRRAPRQSLEHSAPPQDAMRVRLDRGRPIASDYISGSIQNGYVRAEVLAAKGA